MLKSIGILLIAIVFVLIEVPPLLKKKYKKEILVFFIFLIVGTVMSMSLAFGKPFPNPFDLLTFILKPLNEIMK